MMKLTDLLLQISYDLHYSPNDWAKELNIPLNEVGSYFTGEKEVPFFPFLLLVRQNYQDYEKQKAIFSTYAETLYTAPNILYAMELTSQMGEIELLNKLIEKGNTSSDSIVQEWAEMYTFLHNRDKIREDDFFYNTKKATLKSTEMQILLETLRAYILTDLEANMSIDKLYDDVSPQLEKVENEYIRNALQTRLHSSTVYSMLRLNLVGKVRKIGEQYLNDEEAKLCFPIKYTYILHRYAMSFLYENPDKAIKRLEDSIDILKQLPNAAARHYINEHEKSIAFVKNLWEIDQPEPDDIPEKIHYFIAQHQYEKAQALLLELKKKQPLTEFQDYYWGIAFSDEKALQRSYERFRSNGNFFFAVLPVRQLSRISLERLKNKKLKN
ncbi:hypothetical protein GCM10008967_03200 [Bacillus carboniphilus]|uniref:Uncharacterized protein n=1 Tax=Bacillus carboniphilus TaxID=86663 RepID=A0ABN0VS58_9BACI